MTTYTDNQIAKLTEIGNLWVSSDGSKQRIYFNDLEDRMLNAFGLTINYYSSGNVSSATCINTLTGQREPMSNADAKRWLQSVPRKLWFDMSTQKFAWEGGDRETNMGIVNQIKTEIGQEIPA